MALKIRLRRNQFKLSERSASMAIWLGKQYLGQKDSIEVSQTSNGQLAELIDGLKEPPAAQEE